MRKSLTRTLSIATAIILGFNLSGGAFYESVKASPDKNAKHAEKTSDTPDVEVVYETGTQNSAKTKRDDAEKIKSEDDGSFEVVIPGKTVADENGEIVVSDETIDGEDIEWEEIHISNVEEFEQFAKNCKLDTWSKNKNVYLDNDILIVDADYLSIPTFGGHFYGKNHTISGYTMYEARSFTGLFDYVQEGAVIEGVVLKASIRADGKQMVTGGLAGENHGEIRNCVFDGNISGQNYVGGLAGYNELTGSIINCKAIGMVSGAYYTGGIVGENVGNISSCTNEAAINTVMIDRASSIQDIDLSAYADGIISKLTGKASEKEKSANLVDTGSVDTGGIAGLSIGVIQFCDNNGEIGYEHVGYNVGGIVGRQSGYVHGCINNGVVRGRKDVGGITGQAEPYVVVDFTEDTITKLSENIDKLHDVIDSMLGDAGISSDTISNRLSIVKQFTDRALNETSFLSNKTIDWTNGMVGAGNDLMSRAQFIMSETAKSDGPIQNGAEAFSDAKVAADNLDKTVNDLDIYKYMDDTQKSTYISSREKFEYLTKTITEYEEKYTKAAENYYIQKKLTEDETADPQLYPNSHDLRQIDANGNELETQLTTSTTDLEQWRMVDAWKHVPSSEAMGTAEGDSKLISDATTAYKEASEPTSEPTPTLVKQKAEANAKTDYQNKYGVTITSVDRELADQASEMAGVIIVITPKMEGATRDDARKTAESVKNASEHLTNAGYQTKSIISEMAGKGQISMPSLGEDYRNSTNALNAALQGMSDNMGALNDEMSNSSDVMIDDMSEVNDQFNIIMQLYTDAIDGVLDRDYGDNIEDSSMEVAETCMDATIAECENHGKIEGDIDVAGITGAMGIEYDFDLESDITKSDNATFNSTYQSKCVLRKNINNAHIIAQKSYAGGICGLQEIGTILSCENYGKVKSNSSDYVGGISGDSLSYIQKSISKCFLYGKNYVGGIAGHGCNILNCYAMVEIDSNQADSFYGAIAGDVTDEGKVHYNYYVGDDLAGIDRISYKGQAEPIDYYTFISMDTTPKTCSKMYVIFYVDDIETDRIETEYGGTVLADQFPIYVRDDGTYCKWNKSDLANMVFDVEVEGEYSRYVSTLASDQLRINGQSAILVDGRFKDGDKLQSTLWDANSLPMERAVEHWELNYPSSQNDKHLIRYKNPDNIETDVELYLNHAGKWEKIDVEQFGQYKTFEVSGPYAEIAVLSIKKNYTKQIVVGILIVLCIISIIIIIYVVKRRKNRTANALTKEQDHKDEDNGANAEQTETEDIEIINIDDESV